LGGDEREKPLKVEDLTNDDLVTAMMDVRSNADQIYKDIYEEFSYVTDMNRTVQPEWVADAREKMVAHQQMVVENLEEKDAKASDTTYDEFMYQDKEEAMKELEVAKKMLEDLPAALRSGDLEYRTWNPLPYDRYRS